MTRAFQPSRLEADEHAARADGYEAVLARHYLRIRDERRALEDSLAALQASAMIDEALAIASDHLPSGAVPRGTQAPPVHLAFFGPDAYADDGAVYLDLVEATDRGAGLVLLLAHEFHHFFYARSSRWRAIDEDDELYWLAHTLRQLHQEGLADRIDKQRYPVEVTLGASADYVDDFNRHYRDALKTLRSFDAALVEMARQRGRVAELARSAWDLFHYGAHPEGFFMANTIAAVDGGDALLLDVGDPVAFVRRFRAAAERQLGSPVFSDEALAFLAQIDARLAAPRD